MRQTNCQWAQKIAEHGIVIRREDGDAPEMPSGAGVMAKLESKRWLIAGALSLFLLGTSLYFFSTTSMGIFLGTLARSMPQLGLLVLLVILPLVLLSGAVAPRESMPQIVQIIMEAAPTTHFVSLTHAIIYRGAGFDVVWPQFAIPIVIGAVFFTTALLWFRKAITLTG